MSLVKHHANRKIISPYESVTYRKKNNNTYVEKHICFGGGLHSLEVWTWTVAPIIIVSLKRLGSPLTLSL